MLLCVIFIFVYGCKKDNNETPNGPAKLPILTTALSVTNINSNSAMTGGIITDDKGATVTARGVCWSTGINPTTKDSLTKDGSGIGTFYSNLKNLHPNTSYYVRAYATNSVGTAYGSALNFTTDIDFATLITSPISLITSISATSGGNITSDGGSPVTVRGICWSTNQNPTIGLLTKTIDGNGTGIFTSVLSGLTKGTTYYVRAYATNENGTKYGNSQTFSTAVDLPLVTTVSISTKTARTAIGGGSITSDNGGTITAKGVCWNKSNNPTINNDKTSNGNGTGSFTSNLIGLEPNTLYYVRAYATNSSGTGYGDNVTFTTNSLSVPSLTTSSVSNILAFSASGGGNITYDGGDAVTSRGICWSINPSPTTALDTKIITGTGTGTFISNMTGLLHGTKIYIRAFATNSVGTSYGNELNFTTQNGKVTLTTNSVSSILAFSGVSGGNISNNGGTPVIASGICWGTSSNPTITLSTKTTNGTISGSFISNLSGLTHATKYYVRAYATNAVGTTYGNETSFTTQNGVVNLSTTAITHIAGNSASTGANITDNGGTPIITRGVCWSTNLNPTVQLSTKTIDGTGEGTYISNLANLVLGSTYYVRSYATNAVGTTYGNEIKYVFGGVSYSYLGGFVFYVDGTGLHGLVCSTSDEGNGYAWSWYNYSPGYNLSYPLIGATGTTVGTGRSNTDIMLKYSYEAAVKCNAKSPVGTWYLPSKDELNLIYNNLKKTGVMTFTSSVYWSSSEVEGGSAISIDFSTGLQSSPQKMLKSNGHYVRAIRSF